MAVNRPSWQGVGGYLLPMRARESERGRGQEMTIDKNTEGAWRISKIVGEGAGGYTLTRTYYFYTKREAISLFKQEIKRERVRA